MNAAPRSRGLNQLVPKIVVGVVASVLAAAAVQGVAGAHTEADIIGVAAGEQVTLNLRPNHGCGDSPTIEVAILAPLEGATAEPVDGWNATSEGYGEGQTVLEWADGVLPTEEIGAFPVTFIAPDSVGELLLFPSVQVCENGDELPWISGDPGSEYPAPRLLILPPGSVPAATIDDVPAGTPGRELLTSIVDPTPATAPSTTQTTASSDDSSGVTTSTVRSAEPDAPDGPSEDDGIPLAIPVLAGAAVVIVGGGLLMWKRRSAG
ncbi:DUF1775 domain-containing protein [Actinomarinicola tropica]|uniref:DUF1775 domain-containing protein n=1 Tax=Actinomarinicola tropica TaxID=2789776 RepID=A0A5Q2RMT1_9ACTN|nr:DUF1775 domain-containing protein [Actinomarinicola tropica]QGG96242.1 DUF1775 domain-containing protein [Actinomarinicola tropica]